MPFELLSPLIEKVIRYIEGELKGRQDYQRYLDSCLGETIELHQAWLDDGYYKLSTLEAFIPVQLRLTKNRTETISLKSALAQHNRLVVMGHAGAGKSTLSKYIAALLAGALKRDAKYAGVKYRTKQEFGIEDYFPIYIDLVICNDEELENVLFSRACNERKAKELIEDKLQHGNCFVIFDGLDEIVDDRRRMRVMREIASISSRYGDGNYFMVTTRPAGYHQWNVLGSASYRHYDLAEWSDEQQEKLIRRYYGLWNEKRSGAESGQDWKERANDLIGEIKENDGLRRLKNNPLMLSIITYLSFRSGEEMPKQEHKVYEEILRYLIKKKDQRDLPNEEISKKLFGLGLLAFEMFERKERESISGQDLIKVLKRWKYPAPEEQIKNMVQDWGVMVKRNDTDGDETKYAFVSHSFQVYLAAYAADKHLQAWKKLQKYLKDNYEAWEEVALMYASMSTPNEKILKVDRVLQIIFDDSDFIPNRKHSSWINAGRCIASAGKVAQKSKNYYATLEQLKKLSYGEQPTNIQSIEVLCMIDPDGKDFILKRIMGHLLSGSWDNAIWEALGKMTDPYAIQHLQDTITKHLSRYSIEDRVSLGRALAIIRDDRLGRFAPLSDFSHSRNKLEIGIYPVTNWEYGKFIREAQYPPPKHWAGRECPIGKANHPVTHVSFKDARAYCRWMTEETGIETRLPSEEEWMYAANKNGDFKYPWESPRIGEMYLNYRHKFDGTTPVGIYPDGKSPLGVMDLMGNVWEWTESKKGGKMILRGGAWDTNDLGNGIHERRLVEPGRKENNIGFRVVRRYQEID